MAFAIRPLGPNLGAEILGIDFNQPLGAEAEAFVRDAWIRHGVLLVRSPDNSDEAQLRFSQMFGDLDEGAVKFLNNADNPYLMTLQNDPQDVTPRFQTNYVLAGQERAGWLGWHWDQSFMPTIVRGAVLRMAHPAAAMGRTGFIDAVGAYDRLSDAMKARVESLEVVYEFNGDMASGQFGFPEEITPVVYGKELEKGHLDRLKFPPVVHPLVITQGETGRKILKLSPMHSRYILGMERSASDALLAELAAHLCDNRFAYWHDWQHNDMLVWDNWRVIHSAEGVPPAVKRVAMRTTIKGDYNVGRYLDPALDRARDVARIVD